MMHYTRSCAIRDTRYAIRKSIVGILLYCVLSIAYSIGGAFAEEAPALTSQELITKSWEAHGKRDVEATFTYTRECIDRYQQEAEKIQVSLQEMPKSKNDIEAAGALNDVATAYFIQAESYMRQDKPQEAKKLFQLITEKFPFAQAWDQRGWYWSIADASKQSIKKIETGSIELDQKKKVSQLPTKVVLYDSGTEDFVDYARYGTFENIGTKEYRYIIKDQEGLMAAVGEGIYPN
ncbi:MAG: tetratricopeptide repeat protein, partial [Candidatus Omnitrophota bacterium]